MVEYNSAWRAFVRSDNQWQRLLTKPVGRARAALFLDRDGVLIQERGYLQDPNLVSLIDDVGKVCSRAAAVGIPIVVVSNQSGIGRGIFGWAEHFAVENRLIEDLSTAGGIISASFACPDHPGDHESTWRKPMPGMFLAAASALNLDLSRSFVVGDKLSDLIAAERAGISAGAHVLTGHGADERAGIAGHAFEKMRWIPLASLADLPDAIIESLARE